MRVNVHPRCRLKQALDCQRDITRDVSLCISASVLSLSAVIAGSQGKVRWAMAGRDQKRLEEIRGQLVKIDPDSEVGCCG